MKNFLENVEYTAIPLHPDIIDSVPRENQQILWVGCTESQVIETDVINVPRSEMFVHRNLGNVLSNGEISSLGAIDYCSRLIKVLMSRRICGQTHYINVNSF
jgi:carbonic anhydrase